MRPSIISRRSFLSGGASVLAPFMVPHRALARAHYRDVAQKGVVRYQGWAGRVMYPELAEALGYMAPLRLKWLGNISSGPQDLQAMVTGETDLASAFNGAIMKMVSVGAPLKAVFSYSGTNKTECSGILVAESAPIYSARDLIGKVIGVNTLRAQSECFVYQYLHAQGLTAEEQEQITLVAVPPSVGRAALAHGRVDAVVVEGFFRDEALQHGAFREIARDVDYYGLCNLDSIALRDSYIQDRSEDAAHFVTASARAIIWAQQTPAADVAALMKEIILKRKRSESILPIQYWKSCSVATKGGVLLEQDFTRLRPWFAARDDKATASFPACSFYDNHLNAYA